MRYVLCTLLLLLLLAQARADPRTERRGTGKVLAESTWGLTYSVRFENPSPGARTVELYMPLAPHEPPCQEVLSRLLPSREVRRLSDGSGNTVGLWKVRIPAHREKTLTFIYKLKTAHVRWHGDSGARAAPPSSARMFLGEGRLIECRNRNVVRTAAAVCAGEDSPYYRMLRLYDYLMGHYRFDPHQGIYGAAESLGRKSLQCADAALLFTALARASGIPSRLAGGLFISFDRSRYRQLHAWSEVLLPGLEWAAVDPTLGRFDPGHRLICFLERRSDYITLWRGTHTPFAVRHPRASGLRTAVSLVIDVKRISYKVVPIHGSRDEITRYYRSLPLPKVYPSGPAPSRESIDKHRKGTALAAAHRWSESRACFFAALDGSPAYLDPCVALLSLFDKGHERDAIERGFRARRHATASYGLGEILRRRALYSASRYAFDRAAVQGFPGPRLHLARMRLFALTKETDKFDESLRACVSLDNRNLDVYSEALLFFQNLRDWDMCLYWSWRGRMRLPESSLFPAMEGFAYLQKGELRKARASAEEAVRRDPTMGWYHCILGWILVEQGDLDGAKRAIEKGIALRTGVSNPGFFRSLLKKK